MGLENGANASLALHRPVRTASTGTSSEVTGMGTGSQIHHVHTRHIMASRPWALVERSAMGVIHTMRASKGPTMRPTRPRGLSEKGSLQRLR